MRVSLKTILLFTALVAVFTAWVRVSQTTASIERKLMRNANQGNSDFTIPERDAPPSVLVLDATGAVKQARLYGPNGFAELDRRANALTQVKSVSLNSVAAVDLFIDREFTNLTWLSVADGFDIDLSQFSFDWLKPLSRLEGLNIFAFGTDPRSALSTFPEMQPLMLVLRTSETKLCEDFPKIKSVSKLVVNLPDGVDANAFLDIAIERMPECDIEIED